MVETKPLDSSEIPFDERESVPRAFGSRQFFVVPA